MSKPTRVYYVQQKGAKLPPGQRGSGLFASLPAMLGRARTIEQRGRGGTAKCYYADVEWKELTDVEVE